MTRSAIILVLGLVVATAPAAWAFTCPVVIKQSIWHCIRALAQGTTLASCWAAAV